MKRFLRSALRLVLRRVWSRRWLMGCLLVGLVTAVALLSSVPMYSDAINKRLLNSELEGSATLPPFAFVWRYIGAFDGDITLDQYAAANDYLTNQAADVIDLPLQSQVRHLRSPRLQLWPTDALFSTNQPLLNTNVGVLTDLTAHIQLVDGTFPAAGASEMLISLPLAEATGLQVGERYRLEGGTAPLEVTISGIWQPLDTTEAYWFYQPTVFDEMLLTSEETFLTQVAPLLPLPLTQVVWYQIFDGGRFLPNDVPVLLGNVSRVETQSSGQLPGVTLDASPVRALETYGTQARVLTLLLTIFAVPIVGLVLYFVSLIASMIVQRGQNEIAVLRSRGLSRRQVLLIYLGEGVLIGGIGLLLGLLLGQGLAQLMTQTERFLVFSQDAIPALLSGTAVRYGLIGVGLCLLALLLPAFLTGKHTIVSLRTSRSRQSGRTFAQRTYLDLLLLIPPFYGLYLLQQQGSIGSGNTVFNNPLLFLVPALFCLALSLLFLRLFPVLLSLPLWLWERQLSIPTLLTLRQLARATVQYSGPLLLLCLTLSLAVFTASMAQTLDDHLTDELYYQTGADLNLAELGEPIPVPEGAEPQSLGFSFLPVEDHLAVDGVQTATRVGSYRATVSIGGQQSSGQLMGLDRLDFPQVGFFRDDFAADPLIGLLNRLATRRNGLLVNQGFLQQRSLAAGDPLSLTVDTGSKFAEIPFIIVGTFDLFPTWYPDEGALFIGHLVYMHEKMDGSYPYDVWLATDGVTSAEQIVSQARQRGFTVVTAQDARAQVTAARTQPARQGVFGLLSVGFFAAALLTVLGYLVFAVVGFQRRVVELGMLRALGLSTRQMGRHLASEQAVLIFTGMGVGTLVGVLASRLFIPFLQVGVGRTAQVPPFVVQLAWEQLLTIYAIFGVMLLVAIGALGWFLTRLKLFEAVKLGETV